MGRPHRGLLASVLGARLPFRGQDMPINHTLESRHITGLAVDGLVASVRAEPARRRLGRSPASVASAALCAVDEVLLALAPAAVLSAAAMLFVGVA